MPAGIYTIGIDVESQRITLRDDSGQHHMFLMGTPEGDGNDKSELVFEHSGDIYALQEVKSDVFDLSFRTRVAQLAMASGTSSPQVEVAPMHDAQRAVDRLRANQVRYRAVLENR